MNKYKIIDIPEKMEKYYGRGKMLHPSVEMVEDVIRLIPLGSVATIDTIAKKMANEAGVDVSCPLRTGNAIKEIANRFLELPLDQEIPFWRALKKDGKVIKSNNYELAATRLEEEGFQMILVKNDEIKVQLSKQDSRVIS